jgi:hypothetical protein
MSSHGEVGAAYVTWPDGHRSVLTHGPGLVAPLLDIARAAGIPAPCYELAVDLGDDAVVVQELPPGVPPSTVDRALVYRMLGLHDRFAGLLADHPELPLVELYLRRSPSGYRPGDCARTGHIRACGWSTGRSATSGRRRWRSIWT